MTVHRFLDRRPPPISSTSAGEVGPWDALVDARTDHGRRERICPSTEPRPGALFRFAAATAPQILPPKMTIQNAESLCRS